MEIDVKNLPQSPDLLKKIILDLSGDLQKEKKKQTILLEEIRLLRQRKFGSSSEKDPKQNDLFDESGIDLPVDVQAQLSDTEEVEVKPHTRKKHPIRKKLPDYLPREVIEHDLPLEEKVCECGEHMVRIGEETSEQLKYIPAKVCVIQHVRPKYACKPCQANIKIAPMPKLLLPKSIATPELVAHTIISKYADALPLYRQEAIWQRMEIDIPRSSLCGWILKTAELCEPLIDLLRKNIISYDYAQADETPVQVLNEVERSNTTKSYMWIYRGGGDKRSLVYEYQPTRGGYHPQKFLQGFKGYLQTDAYSGYNWAENNDEITSVFCHAHARRPFAELVKLHKRTGLAREAIQFYKKLYKIEKYARENKLSPTKRYELRLEKSVPILNAFEKWLHHNLPKTSEQSKIGKAIRYCVAHWAELNNFLKDGRLEIDNNLAENAIRPFAIGRKNWLFKGSPKGAKAGAIFYSLIETCKANKIDPYQYLCAMLNRIRKCVTDEDYSALLPQNITL